ncbi:MAG: YceG family protein [Oscillospiraceae bacterium]|nr:YceG family protein [Oscillospiraceae bacterium]
MFEHRPLTAPDGIFTPLSGRQPRCVYCCRITTYSPAAGAFIRKYYDAARRRGVILEGGIPNPTPENISYYQEIMGAAFQMSKGFLNSSLAKWLPRMSNEQRESVASAMFSVLDGMQKQGKNENMLKNAYTKFMCWLYYKFERITAQLGDNEIPKILYEGSITNYELLMLDLLSQAGCDVVMLLYKGDVDYQKLDPSSKLSQVLSFPGSTPFPADYSLKAVRQAIQKEANRIRIYGQLPTVTCNVNSWTDEKPFDALRKPLRERGSDQTHCCTCFFRMKGVEDKQTYPNELFRLYDDLKQTGRRILILEQGIPEPTNVEIQSVHRSNFTDVDRVLQVLAANLQFPASQEIHRMMVKAFLDLMFEAYDGGQRNLNQLTNTAVILISWVHRYQEKLFHSWKAPETAVVLLLGGCRDERETLFIRFLTRLPVDIMILVPDLNKVCCLQDPALREIGFPDSLVQNSYPTDASQIVVGTTAYHAERELDTMLYDDTGMYRNQQYGKADAVTLRTMYEEIALLWKEEARFRPNFGVNNHTVSIPVIFAKVSGVKDSDIPAYWNSIKELVTEDTFAVTKPPYRSNLIPSPLQNTVGEFFDKGRLNKQYIRCHPSYQYGFLREEMQDHILDKLQLLIDSKMICNLTGAEFLIASTILSLDIEMVRLIQRFDFTKVPPKFVYVNTGEAIITPQDAIIAAFLHLIGFDVLFWVPTGYQSVERYFKPGLLEEHQIGDYVYDLNAPDLKRLTVKAKKAKKSGSWPSIFRKRGK